MSLETQSAPEKSIDRTNVSDSASSNLSQQIQDLMKEDFTSRAGDNLSNSVNSGFPSSDNILNAQDSETRQAFGLESEGNKSLGNDSQETELERQEKQEKQESKQPGDGPDGKNNQIEDGKAEQVKTHDVNQVDHQDGESSKDNLDATASTDGKDKKSKTGDADKDTGDSGDSDAGKESLENTGQNQPGEESNAFDSSLAADSESQAKAQSDNDSKDNDTEVKGGSKNNPGSNNGSRARLNRDTVSEQDDSQDGQETIANSEEQLPKNERDPVSDTASEDNDNGKELVETLEETHKKAEDPSKNQTNAKHASSSTASSGQEDLDFGLRYASTAALYRPSLPLH